MVNVKDSDKWRLFMRVLFILVGIIQLIVTGWITFITSEVLETKYSVISLQVQLQGIKENMSLIDRVNRTQGR